jgi:hypothetical protein
MEPVTRKTNVAIRQLETDGVLTTLIVENETVTLLKAKIDPEYTSGIRVKIKRENGEKHWIDSSFIIKLKETNPFR